MPSGKIPTDFTHVADLNAAGVSTFKQLGKYAEDYTQLSGIGPSKAADISAAIAALDAVPAEQPPVDAPAPAPEPVPDTAPLSPVESHLAVVVAALEPAKEAPEKGVACKYQSDRDTVVDAEVFGISAEDGTADHVDAVVNGRFRSFKGVRQASTLGVGVLDSVGCYSLPTVEKKGAGA